MKPAELDHDLAAVFGTADPAPEAAPIEEAAHAAMRELHPVDLADIASPMARAVRFVVEKIIPGRHVTLLSGHGGTGKSYAALGLAAHVASGHAWGPFSVQHGRSVFCSLEDEGDLVRWRLGQIVRECGLPAAEVARNMDILDGTESLGLAAESPQLRGELVELPALQELEALAEGASLIVVDNASDAAAFDGNVPRLVRVFLRRMLGRIARRNDAAVLLLAHVDKQAARFGGAGQNFLGAAAWHNSVRSRLALLKNEGRIELHHEKCNVGPELDAPVAMRRLGEGVLVPGEVGGVPDAATALLAHAADEAVLAALRAAVAQGVTVGAARTGPATAHAALQTLPDLPGTLRGAKGRERFWAALTRLQRAGKVRTVEVRDSHRNLRQHLEPVEDSAGCVSSRACVSSPTPPSELTHALGRASFVCVDSDNKRELTNSRKKRRARAGRVDGRAMALPPEDANGI